MTTIRDKRPLSPHLQVYRPQITSVMSITHRATGFFLSIGTLFLVAWLWAAAYDGEYFAFWQMAAKHWVGQLALLGWTFAFFYHLCNGIRHLFWDMGKGYELANVTRSGILVILTASIMTVLTWYFIATEIYEGVFKYVS